MHHRPWCFLTTMGADGRSHAARPLTEPDIRCAEPLTLYFGAPKATRARPSHPPPEQPARIRYACWRSRWWTAPSRAPQHRKCGRANPRPAPAPPPSLPWSRAAPAPVPRRTRPRAAPRMPRLRPPHAESHLLAATWGYVQFHSSVSNLLLFLLLIQQLFP